jgi:hypothetical protein
MGSGMGGGAEMGGGGGGGMESSPSSGAAASDAMMENPDFRDQLARLMQVQQMQSPDGQQYGGTGGLRGPEAQPPPMLQTPQQGQPNELLTPRPPRRFMQM